VSNGCLLLIVARMGLIILVICIIGVLIGYRIITGASVPLLSGVAMTITPAPARGGGLSITPSTSQPAPTVGGVVAATDTFTTTRQITEAGVGSLAYAPSGQLIAVGIGNSIQLRFTETLDQGATMTGHGGTITALAFSPDGTILASSAQDENMVILWDMVTAQERIRLKGHTGWVRSLAFSPDGATLASGGIDKTVRLWDVASGRELGVLEGHSDYVGNIAFSPDGSTLASASRDGTVRLWDVAARQPRAGFMYTAPTDPATGAPDWLTGLAYSPDGQSIAVGSASGSIYVIDPSSGQLQRELKGHAGWVVIRGLSYSPDGRTLASASTDGTVRLWSPLTGTERATLKGSLRLIGLSWAPDSQHLATTSDTGGSLTVWNTQSREAEHGVQIAQGAVTTMAYSDNGAILGTGGASGTVRVHYFSTDRQQTLNGGMPTSQFIGFVSDTQLAALSDAGEVVIIDLTGQDRNRQIQGLPGSAVSLAVSRDHSLLAVGSESGEVALWDVDNQKLLRTLRGLDGPAMMVVFNRDASLIVAEMNQDSGQSRIMVWETQSGARRATITSQKGQITAMVMPANGDVVAGAGSDGSLTLWSATDGSVLRTITAPADDRWFSSLAFSPDGRLLVTGSVAGKVEFWDVQSGARLSGMSLGAGSVMALAFRPDGRQIAASTFDSGIYLLEPGR